MMPTSRFSFTAEPIDKPTGPEPAAADVEPRTPAQQEASRLNGSRSRGPKTPEGKARSSRNAVTHGMLARKISPPKDGRHENREYELLRAELTQQFDPKTVSDKCYIALLASDWIQLCRLINLRESVMAPGSQAPSCTPADRCVAEVESELELLRTLEDCCKKGVPLALEEPIPRWLIRSVRRHIEVVRKVVQHFRSLVSKGRKRIDSKLRNDAKAYIAAGVERLDPDDEAIIAVLTSVTALKKVSRHRWSSLLGDLRVEKESTLRLQQMLQAAHDQQLRHSHPFLLGRLTSLETLTRYETAIRRKIDRTTKNLDERCGRRHHPGSFGNNTFADHFD